MQRSMRIVAAVTVACALHGIPAIGYDDDEDPGPWCLRDPGFWKDRFVVQTRGWVLAPGDRDHIIRKEYWRLGPAAIGRVTSVREDLTAIVEFDTDKGWQKCGFEEREIRAQRLTVENDQYGRPIAIRVSEIVREGIQVEPGDHGHLLEIADDGQRRVVQFPLNCLGLAVPSPGMRVVPGPDLVPHEARRFAGMMGTVVEPRDADHYLTVRWDDGTDRERPYRFDVRRHYDVLPSPAVRKPAPFR